MTGNDTETITERLTLRSRISDLEQVAPWIDALVPRYEITEKSKFAIELCLEEALSNIIRHGYSNEPDHSLAVQLTNPRKGYLVFIVEDEAPPFNPVDSPDLPSYPFEDDRVGGQGIRLMRRFADTLEYLSTPAGNRLSIGFFTAGSVAAKD
jgi:anti-sigma regulatory factor (Ser/Thr protein kinase)